jgi:hypothetical protein
MSDRKLGAAPPRAAPHLARLLEISNYALRTPDSFAAFVANASINGGFKQS